MERIDPNTIPEGYTYDENKRVISWRGQYPHEWKIYKRDDAGRVIEEIGDRFHITHKFDRMGKPLRTHNLITGYWDTHEYDENGRLIKIENSKGYFEKYIRDSKGKIIKVEKPQ